MNSQDNPNWNLDELAAEYALGTLEGEELERLEADLANDSQAQRTVAEWQAFVALIADAPPTQPKPQLWRQIEDAVHREIDSDASMWTIRDGTGEWITVLPGVEKQTLFVDHNTNTESFYLRLAPGSNVPAHEHETAEECLMLSGSMEIGDLRLESGDYHVAAAGTQHEPIVSREGAVVFVRASWQEAA